MKSFLLPALALFSISAYAQPVLTNVNNIQAGTTYTGYNVDLALPEGPGGANVTWDFTSLSLSSSTNYGYYTCGSAGHSCNLFPGSMLSSFRAGQYLFYRTSDSKLAITGYATGSASYVYHDPQEILRFPFTYNDTYTDVFLATYNYAGYSFIRKGTITVIADGYGTLMLPGATYRNVLRIKKTENYIDSSSGPRIPYSAETYTWYSPYLKEMLANKVTLTIAGVPNKPAMQYTVQPTTGTGLSLIHI